MKPKTKPQAKPEQRQPREGVEPVHEDKAEVQPVGDPVWDRDANRGDSIEPQRDT